MLRSLFPRLSQLDMSNARRRQSKAFCQFDARDDAAQRSDDTHIFRRDFARGMGIPCQPCVLGASFAFRILHVVFLRAWEQMGCIAAGRVIACMAGAHAVGKRPMDSFIRIACRRVSDLLKLKIAVALVVFRTKPGPALVRPVVVNIAPKRLFQALGLSFATGVAAGHAGRPMATTCSRAVFKLGTVFFASTLDAGNHNRLIVLDYL